MDATNKYFPEVHHAEAVASGLSASVSAVETKRQLHTEVLFAGAKEVAILHGNEEYMLKITKQGKLILTK